LRLLTHWVRRAASRADCTAGNNRAIRTAMMAMTTRSSMSVKARRFRNSTTHPPFRKGRVRNRRTHGDADRETTGLIVGWVAYLLPHHELNLGARVDGRVPGPLSRHRCLRLSCDPLRIRARINRAHFSHSKVNLCALQAESRRVGMSWDEVRKFLRPV